MDNSITTQTFINNDSANLSQIENGKVNLIVTSPPYPMIDMWNDIFFSQGVFADDSDEQKYERMHDLLNKIWQECDRVLAENGFVCVNIGDSVKNSNGKFRLFPNHTKIIDFFSSRNYYMLPTIIWYKPSNSPNKFMGSGMLPAGAYVTLEHEYILVFRKGTKRNFLTEEDKINRRKSAYFWEERNIWFSNIWNIRGSSQKIFNVDRKRSGAFPFEIPFRLINMYSTKGDIVLDPFSGTGTTLFATAASQRNGIGVEISSQLVEFSKQNLLNSQDILNKLIQKRLSEHIDFIKSLPSEKQSNCYVNSYHNFPVKTMQEQILEINRINEIKQTNKDIITCFYEKGKTTDVKRVDSK